jgi:hypothetical protein
MSLSDSVVNRSFEDEWIQRWLGVERGGVQGINGINGIGIDGIQGL